ncbi:TauD/TfdA family dioxygenase [Legionella cardiaca]|uniref:TauD/TfdA family dioxygenase n=1 Tax=Legionella cardiaca TaxID=1071983 RepID=A0ABY8AMB8_9GAMM|nr:TauD/TfdA family dioxygenase [Legionella cardiaca]WED41795.1 TauD/TfdA family dioxygenase [Legionella cardiaca]
MEDFSIQEGFPTVFTFKKTNASEWKQKIPHYKAQIQQQLLTHGALLFRDLPLTTAEHFSDFIKAINLGTFVNYIGGDSPRDKVINKIYTSTEAPPHIYIPLHQELSYLKTYPAHVYFYCEIEPEYQGETVIADARKIYNSLDPEVVSRFREKELTYISHYYQKSALMTFINYLARSHKSWMDVFETDSKTIVEQFCQTNEIRWRWLRGNWIELKHTRPALLQHPITKETVWFNQAHLYDFNPKLLGLLNFLAVKLLYFRRLTRLHEVIFADGSTISRADLYHILDTLKKHTVSFPWKKGDVMVLDNVLTMHGRAPFKGKRRILTALTT